MPSDVEHNKQYQHNKSLLQFTEFCVDSTNYYDWVITIIFYAAVHLVEDVLANSNNPSHSKDHFDRKIQILANAKLRPVASQYLTIYNQSIRARYKCLSFTKTEIENIIRDFNLLEKAASQRT